MADQFLFDDGELRIPSDFFSPSFSSSTATTETDHHLLVPPPPSKPITAQLFPPFTTLPNPVYTTPTTPTLLPDLHLQLFEPMVWKDSVSADYFASPGNPYSGGIWTGPRSFQTYPPSFNPVQPQIGRERDGDMQRQGKWFLHSRVVENRLVRVDGPVQVGLTGFRSGYGGTGVYLPDYTTITTTTISTGPRKRQSVRVTKQLNKACSKRCSPNKAHASKEDECNFELPLERILPQEWTY